MYQIKINTNWCKGCGICTDFCPQNVYDITIGMEPKPTRVEDCIGCKICEIKCPDFAIEVKEMEARNNE